MSDLNNSTLVFMTNMPDGTEPAYIYNLYHLSDGDSVTEIEEAYGESCEYGFYLYFKTPADAQAFNLRLDKSSAGEFSHIYKKEINVKVIHMSAAPDAVDVKLRLTDYLHANKAMPRTKTVRIRGMVTRSPLAHVKRMLNEAFDLYNPNDDPMYGPVATDYHPGFKHVFIDHACFDNEAIVRLTSEDAAKHIVGTYNGWYYNNTTTYAVCVDDEEIEAFIEMEEEQSKRKTAHLFIPQVKPNASEDTVRNAFAPYEVYDVNMKSGKRWAHVFMAGDDAEKFFKVHPQGKFYGGWFYKVRPGHDGKKAKAKRTIAGPSSAAQAPISHTAGSKSEDVSQDMSQLSLAEHIGRGDAQARVAEKPVPLSAKVRISKLANNAIGDHIRKFLQQYKITAEDIVVNAPEHEAIVTLSQDDVETAMLLTNKKILKRQVLVEKV